MPPGASVRPRKLDGRNVGPASRSTGVACETGVGERHRGGIARCRDVNNGQTSGKGGGIGSVISIAVSVATRGRQPIGGESRGPLPNSRTSPYRQWDAVGRTGQQTRQLRHRHRGRPTAETVDEIEWATPHGVSVGPAPRALSTRVARRPSMSRLRQVGEAHFDQRDGRYRPDSTLRGGLLCQRVRSLSGSLWSLPPRG